MYVSTSKCAFCVPCPQLLNSHPELTCPRHNNVITLLVSATPYCLLTRYSRVPRRQRWVCGDGGGSSTGPSVSFLRDLDDDDAPLPDSEYRLGVSDVHVIDWSETIRRSLAKEPVKAHLRCYVGSVGREDGYWYVAVLGPARDTIGIRCVDDADAGGDEMQLRACREGQSDGEVFLQVASTGQYIQVGFGPDGKRAVSLTVNQGSAAKFKLVLGLGEGLVSLEYQDPSFKR